MVHNSCTELSDLESCRNPSLPLTYSLDDPSNNAWTKVSLERKLNLMRSFVKQARGALVTSSKTTDQKIYFRTRAPDYFIPYGLDDFRS